LTAQNATVCPVILSLSSSDAIWQASTTIARLIALQPLPIQAETFVFQKSIHFMQQVISMNAFNQSGFFYPSA
jgi:hypothetical protein